MSVISIEAAREEVKQWLNNLEVDEEKQNDPYVSAVVKNIAKAVSKGLLVINENGTITQKLIDPLGENGVTTSITYNKRYRIGDYHDKMKKVASGDTLAVMIAKLSVLSGLPELLFNKMMKDDFDVASNITVFF